MPAGAARAASLGLALAAAAAWLPGAVRASVSLIPASGGENMGVGQIVTLSGPWVREQASGEVGQGTIELTVPAGFALAPESYPKVALRHQGACRESDHLELDVPKNVPLVQDPYGFVYYPATQTDRAVSVTVRQRSRNGCLAELRWTDVRVQALEPGSGIITNTGKSDIAGAPPGTSFGTLSTAPTPTPTPPATPTPVPPPPSGPGTTIRVSVSSAGEQTLIGASAAPAISRDGRYVAFESASAQLVAGDTNNVRDVFVRDTWTGTTARVSLDTTGQQTFFDATDPSISADGRYVAFRSSGPFTPVAERGTYNIFLRDVVAGTTTLVSASMAGGDPNGWSEAPHVSADGRHVAFSSDASDLVPGDGNGQRDIFVRDLQAGTTARVSVSSTGAEANSGSAYPWLTPDGRSIAFTSWAWNLVDGDTNGRGDCFVRDLRTGTTARVSLTSTGEQPNADCYDPALSADGRYVAFTTSASNMLPGDLSGSTSVFHRDVQTGATTRASVSTSGGQAAGGGQGVPLAISDDGRYVGFASPDGTIVPNDYNGASDVFVRDVVGGTTTLISVATSGGPANGGSGSPAMSGDARFVAFASSASNLVTNDTNGLTDAFRRER